MTDLHASGRKAATERTQLMRASLRRHHLNEQIFRIMGIVAICAALGFVALLFTNVQPASPMPISTAKFSNGSATLPC